MWIVASYAERVGFVLISTYWNVNDVTSPTSRRFMGF